MKLTYLPVFFLAINQSNKLKVTWTGYNFSVIKWYLFLHCLTKHASTNRLIQSVPSAGYGHARVIDRDQNMTAERGTQPYSAIELMVEWVGVYDEKGEKSYNEFKYADHRVDLFSIRTVEE